MKFTLRWLKDYLETDASLHEISTRLTAIGLEVESLTDPSEKLKDFIVAEIKTAQPHPNASKLQVCSVFDGKDTRQIVCGALNARAGLKVVLAREGVHIPGSGITIKKTKIRDVESNGMLCSAEELGIPGKSEGIAELSNEAVPGTPAAAALGMDDAVIDIAVTPNRGDCLSVYGIARDLAAAGVGSLKPLRRCEPDATRPPSAVTVSILTPQCTHFVGCYIAGVSNRPSPAWMQQRLQAIGLRPISALVDITNYLCFSMGRPLHVFDANRLDGNLCVRAATEGETLHALNDKHYTLSSGMTVIADEKKALSIAGIIGGMQSGCTMDTTDVYLESAWFEPISIAHTGRGLDILSDARYRFERGTDPECVRTVAELAVAMIVELCGGMPSACVEVRTRPYTPKRIVFSPSHIQALSGVVVDAAHANARLTALGCEVQVEGEAWQVSVPSWRPDISCAADLVEEVVRLVGYDAIPSTPLPAGHKPPVPLLAHVRTAAAKNALVQRGYLEACSYAFLSAQEAEVFGGGALRLQNPISEDLAVMRPSLLPNLLRAARDNLYRKAPRVDLCEVALTYHPHIAANQRLEAAAVRVGQGEETSFSGCNFSINPRSYDAFDAKADAFFVLEKLGVNTSQIKCISTAPSYYHPGRSSLITLGGKVVLGAFGELHPNIVRLYDLTGGAVGMEIYLEALPEPRAKKAKPPLIRSELQPVSRDFAFTMARTTPAETLVKALLAVEKQLITAVDVFDVYTGKSAAEEHASIAIRVTLTPREKTLTDAEIQAISEKLIHAAGTVGATLRQ